MKVLSLIYRYKTSFSAASLFFSSFPIVQLMMLTIKFLFYRRPYAIFSEITPLQRLKSADKIQPYFIPKELKLGSELEVENTHTNQHLNDLYLLYNVLT